MNTDLPRRHGLDLALLLFSATGCLTCSGMALLALALAAASFLQGDHEAALVAEWAAFALGFMALSGVPAVYWSARAVMGREAMPPTRPSRRWAWMAALLPLSLVLGAAAAQSKTLSAAVGPIAQVAAASVPVGMVVLLARRIGPPVRPRRVWGQFLFGLWVSPAAAVVLELALLLPVAAAALLALSLSPQGQSFLDALANPMIAPESHADQLASLAATPWAIGLALFYTALVVPVVEESLKTMGIWPLLLGGKASSGEGFLAGVITGAGFALAEALLMPQPGSLWLAGTIMRVAGTIIHSFTGGLSCWGAAESVRGRSPWPFARRFAAAVFLHGTWNAAIVLIWAAALAFEADIPSVSYSLANTLTTGGSIVLSMLMGVTAVGLPWAARRSMRSLPPEMQEA